MRNLVMRMGQRHFAAYEDSVFRYYIQFGPPGVDLSTFEHILSQWDKKNKKFVFTNRNDGEEIACSFNLEWGPAAVDTGRARGPRDLLHKKKRRAEDDDIPIDAVDIDEDVKQPNEAVEQMEWPQQVIYWKSIVAMNQALHRENENKFKDTPGTVGDIDIHYEGDVNQSLFDEANKESEDPPTGMEINQSENAPPPAIETSTDDEDAPIVFSRALNKKKRGARGAREKVAAAAPLKRKRCKRAVKPSKWVVTPYTEGKKKKEKDNIGD
ncbi:uncharacterized protein A4U43_C01F29540 [Asparagus officinalis]|uniref:Uncharacterized protein n=1 Tax=Asparagus officinalis TaxID=4686 RepID=A0A5P1FT37_ASPOF|nr:uncharacterized protein A4U43_C01F29540 [Asparagus officinalis]